MDSFLHSVAQTLWNRHQGHMEEVLVVFNNRRAGLFLQKQLQGMDCQSFFLPRIIGIDDLINELGELQIAPQEFLLFELYKIHRTKGGEDRKFQTFEEFMSFGEMMLKDFSEIDLYCVDAHSLFNTLKEHKRLGEWTPDETALTPNQSSYLAFFNSLYDYYNELRTALKEQKRAYMGMAYRQVAEQIDSLLEKIKEKHVYFVGFNALSTCETTIIEHCIAEGIGKVIFDGDAYYFDDPQQEAGYFLRRNAQRFPDVGPFEGHFDQKAKTIHIVNCPENILQAKKAGVILNQLLEQASEEQSPNHGKQLENTAVVLADEGLLIPMLNSLPEGVHTVNVTMGYPYTLTEVHNLVTALLSLYAGSKEGRFYHKDLTELTACPILYKILGNKDLHNILTQKLSNGKIIYISPEEIIEMLDSMSNGQRLRLLFQTASPTITETFERILLLAEVIVQSETLKDNVKEKEALACLLQIIDHFKSLQTPDHPFIETLTTLQRIYERMAQRRSISFYGEPLAGLQLLGMLETRSLDFSKLIMLSVNEGTLPAGRGDNTLIPYILKKEYGIPTFKEKDAVFANHFYRMLQRTDEAWLLYSSDSNGMGKGEPSRFILQLKNELAVRYKNITIVEEVVATQQQLPPAPTVTTAEKDAGTLQRLQEIAARGFSPSALNRYRNCPMQFYYSDVLGIKELDEISEDIESNELGSFIHDILCQIYNLDEDKVIKQETLGRALEQLDKEIDRRYQTDVLKKRSKEGKNHLYGEVAKIQIRRFLEKEMDYLNTGHPIQMLLTEYEMKMPLDVAGQGVDTPVLIKGIADRVDFVEGHLRIADYKSGSVEEKELRVESENADFRTVPDKWFQVMAYAWLFYRQYHYEKPFCSGIFPLRMLRADFMPASWNGKKLFDYTDIDRFEQLLKSLVTEMLNPDIAFIASPRNKKQSCKYCPFIHSCHPEQQESSISTKKIRRNT